MSSCCKNLFLITAPNVAFNLWPQSAEKSFSFTVALDEISTIGFAYRNFHAPFKPFLAQKAHENYHKKGQVSAYYTPPLFDNLSKLEQFYSKECDKEKSDPLYFLKSNPSQGGYAVIALVPGKPRPLLLQRVKTL